MRETIYRWSKRILFVSLPLLLLLILLGAYMVDYYAKALTTAGSWPITGTPADIGIAYEEVTLITSDGLKISGWYLPGNKPYGVVVVHGIWANKQAVLPIATILSEAGYQVLVIDLRGHGFSEGDQQSYGYYEALDVIAGVDYLLTRPEIDEVGVIGYSLGGSAAVRATALDERIKALIVESSFSSLRNAVKDSFSQHTGLPSWPLAAILVRAAEDKLGLSVEQISSSKALATMKPRPVMIIHGEEDQLFPVEHANEMYEAAQEPKELWILKGLAHEYPIAYQAEYSKRILEFYEDAFGRSGYQWQ